jgi:hypothetical protein
MINYYVSPDGKGNGTQDNPCSIESIIELLKHDQTPSDVTINVYGGVYHRTETIVINHDVARPDNYGLHWKNVDGQRPVFTSEQHISGWTLHDESKNVWKASVESNDTFEHLWCGRQRLTRAWSGWNPKTIKNTRKGLQLTSEGQDIATWEKPTGLIAFKKMMWRKIPSKVTKISSNNIVLDPSVVKTFPIPFTAVGVMEPIGLALLLNGIKMNMADVALENAYELLSDEGEWFLDVDTSTVYVKPFNTATFETDTELTYARLNDFFVVDGHIDRPISHISIQGIQFQYTYGSKLDVTAGFPMGPTHASISQARSAIRVNAAHHVVIKDNSFYAMGSDAVHCDLHGQDIVIEGNDFVDVSRSAISINQTNIKISTKSKKGVIPENEGKFISQVSIVNNYIRDVGIDAPCQGISFSEFCRDITISHNDISHVGTYAISNNWRFLGWRGHARNIEYSWNKISDVGKEGLEDFGALYVSCADSGETLIHHNYIDGAGINSSNHGIYLDVFTNKAKVFNNVFNNMPSNPRWDWIHGAFFLGATFNIVMSTYTQIRDNWSNVVNYRDFDQGRLRFWRSKTNEVRDNQRVDFNAPLPQAAQEVVDQSGVKANFQHIKTRYANEQNEH